VVARTALWGGMPPVDDKRMAAKSLTSLG
jgi:hypothetical protein